MEDIRAVLKVIYYVFSYTLLITVISYIIPNSESYNFWVHYRWSLTFVLSAMSCIGCYIHVSNAVKDC